MDKMDAGLFHFVDDDNLLLCAIVTVTMQLLFFFIAAVFKFDKVTDFAGGTNFLLLAAITIISSNTYEPRQILISVCILFWSIRLSGFLLFRILKLGTNTKLL